MARAVQRTGSLRTNTLAACRAGVLGYSFIRTIVSCKAELWRQLRTQGRHHWRRTGRSAALAPAASGRHRVHRRGIADPRTCEERVRAGVLEQGTVDLLNRGREWASACAARGWSIMASSCALTGRGHRIDFDELTGGRAITVYASHEMVKDLIQARLVTADRFCLRGESRQRSHDLDAAPRIRFQHNGEEYEVVCDFIAGCDGFHGICRPSIPGGRCAFTRRAIRSVGWGFSPKRRRPPTS